MYEEAVEVPRVSVSRSAPASGNLAGGRDPEDGVVQGGRRDEMSSVPDHVMRVGQLVDPVIALDTEAVVEHELARRRPSRPERAAQPAVGKAEPRATDAVDGVNAAAVDSEKPAPSVPVAQA